MNPRAAPPRVCMVGLGEVGFHWTQSLLAAGYPREAMQSLYLDHGGRADAAVARAMQLGVPLLRSPDDIADSELFLHATSPAAAESVLAACLPVLASGSLWVDLNSTGPASKRRVAGMAAERGVDFVDGAIMAPAWKLGHLTPVWIAGTGGPRFAAWTREWGTPVVDLGSEAGRAADVKMARSVIVKGVAACLVEGLVLAQMRGVLPDVVASLETDFGAEVTDMLCRRFVPGTLQHGERRAAEMDGALELAASCGWDAVTPSASATLLARVGAAGARSLAPAQAGYPELLAALVARLQHGAS